ncbi:MAG: glycosyltransferase family A protein [Sedimenticola sp.]
MSNIEFSLVIVTRNRASTLSESVHYALAQNYPDLDYELLVVDNGSTDDTWDVLNGLHAKTGNRVQIYKEERAGISYARNKGIAEARGEWLLFLDDDAWASSDLLQNYSDLIARHTDAVAWGGGAKLRYPSKIPLCWSQQFDGMLSALDLGVSAKLLQFPEIPYGLNMLIKHGVLDALGGFREQITFGGDETDLFWRMTEAGYGIRYAPDCMVTHAVDFSRFSIAWLLSAAYRSGGYHANFDTLNGDIRVGWKMITSGIANVLVGRRGCMPVATLMYFLRIIGYWKVKLSTQSAPG